jgi:hypothetical protein
MKLQYLLMLGAISMLGCQDRHYLMSYTVDMDLAFTPEQTELVLGGLQQWEQAIPGQGFHLNIRVSTCQAQDVCIIIDHTADGLIGNAVGHTDIQHTDTAAQCHIMVDRIAQVSLYGYDPKVVLQQTVAHELGHAIMGMDHLSAGTLMAFSVQEQATAPTATDIAHFWNVRN